METLFKNALANLLDNTAIYSRSEWARYLLISEPAISQWTNGKTMPKADHLKSILLFLEKYDRQEVQNYIYEFYLMADLPIASSLDEDLHVRYEKYQTVTKYISRAYQYAMDVEISDMGGLFHKCYYYLSSSIARVVKETSEDFSQQEGSFILLKALRSITQKDLENLITSKLLEQTESASNLLPEAIPTPYFHCIDYLTSSVNPSLTCQAKPMESHEYSGWKFAFSSLIKTNLANIAHQLPSNNDVQKVVLRKMDSPQHSVAEQWCLDRMSTGDKDAFKILFHHYARDVGQHVSKHFLPQSDRDELIQNVFVAIWRNRNELTHMMDFKSYLYKTADTCLYIYELEKIRATMDAIDDMEECYASIDKDVKEGFDVVKDFELSNAYLGRFCYPHNNSRL